ncbi:MAG: molybdate ABC transporter substrate-binding protein [Armatimonadetes bacterium CG17_big_fil_post_rev_8_21_14_2_50_66_6]|nr:MAG: molybdate ABC transporter substrate-binding protein [Armatimonadetes bacterium CG17_big_fil_post_rev_8_21_14_2_50_66_6]
MKTKPTRRTALLALLLLGALSATVALAAPLKVFAGSASKPPLEELAALYEKQTGVKVEVTLGGSGTTLSQMIMTKVGDVYLPGSDDFLDKAEEKGAVAKGPRHVVAYLVPAIGVQKGNPKGIKSLQDLAQPGLRVGIGAPKAVCLGDIALELLAQTRLSGKVTPNIVTHANSCEQVGALLRMKQVDAILGWDVFAKWAPDDIAIVQLPPELRKYRYIPAAVTKYAADPKAAQRFVDFLCSATGKAVFKKHGYTVTVPKGKLKHPAKGKR